MKSNGNKKITGLPSSLKPLLWGLKWDDLKIDEGIHDIVTGVINEGTMDQWKWLVETYGKEKIRQVLEDLLVTEFHPESRHLAQLIFSIPSFRHERKLSHRIDFLRDSVDRKTVGSTLNKAVKSAGI